MTVAAIRNNRPDSSSRGIRLKSCLCSQAQLESAPFRAWIERMGLTFKHHRKLWEFAYIAEALEEHGMLRPGRRGLGFAVGREPLAALFASLGCEIVATDLDEGRARELGWTATNQHAARLDDLNSDGICDPQDFRRRVTFRPVDMNDIPDDLEGFDFVWSSCSFEHLGSIAHGRRFINRMVSCLKPDGIAVHTTEFNVSSNDATIDNDASFVIFRQRDIERMTADLRGQGRAVELNLTLGDQPADAHVDQHPYKQQTHLKLQLGPYVATSFGLIAGPAESHQPAAVNVEQLPQRTVAAEWARRSNWHASHRAERVLRALQSAAYDMRLPTAARSLRSVFRRALGVGRSESQPKRPVAARKSVEAEHTMPVFVVAQDNAARLRSTIHPAGGFFCPPGRDFPEGDYTCQFDLEVPASEAQVSIAVLIADNGAWRPLAVSSVAEKGQPRKTLKLPFRLDKSGTVAFHAYTDSAFAQSNFLGMKVLTSEIASAGRVSLPLAAPAPYTTWPLDRVRYVMIGTTSICNASCTHCPTNKQLTRHLPKKVMAFDLFEKLLREFRDTKTPIDGHISFGLYAEPLLDPLVVQRAALVKEYLPTSTLVITSNGGPLTDELALALSRYVDLFSIHIEALTPALYHELMPPLRTEVVFPRVEQLIRLSNKPVWIVCPTHKKNLHEVDALGKYWRERGAAQFVPWGFSNRCTDQRRADEFAFAPKRGDCSELIASDLVIDWDGAVLGCCQDFLKRNQIGDLKTQSLQQLMSADERRQLFENMRAGTRSEYVSCRSCYFDTQDALDIALENSQRSAA
jgi:radical SAM protein with 4Fe4S-binding SPASM domain